MKRRGSVQSNKHGSKITDQEWKVKESKVGQVKDYGVSMIVVSKVTVRRSIWWKVSGVEGLSDQRSWCHRSWCPTSSVKDAGAKGHQTEGHGVTNENLEIKGQEVKGEISVMKRRGSVQNNKHGSKLTGQKWKVKEWKVGQVKDYGVIMVVVSKVTGRRSVGWKVSGVEGRSGERSWCHRSWCPTSSVKDAGAKGYQAKVHEVTGHNLEIKGQEVKGEILVMKRRGSVQNNKHGWKITGQKWKVKESKVGKVKDYGVIIVVVSKVTGRRSVGWKVSGVEYRSGERSWCHRSWCPTLLVKDAGAKSHQAKGHGVTSQKLEIKGQEVKGEISARKRRGSVQNNKHGLKLTGKKWKVKESKVIEVKNYGVNFRSVKGHGSKVGRVKGQWSRRSVRWKILVS